uniref:Uncharacterized protein n=1 Tax=Strigamia maritima TaxID=126957 RepID=T1JI37_STRMM
MLSKSEYRLISRDLSWRCERLNEISTELDDWNQHLAPDEGVNEILFRSLI